MILRKPYAFFIRMFKPIHIIIALLLTYLIYLQNRVLIVFNNYIHTSSNTSTFNFNAYIYIIPILLIIFCVGIFIVMSKKDKPVKLYIVTILLFIGIIIINAITNNFIKQLSENVMPISKIKIGRDLSLIGIIIEGVLFILFLVRGLGINIKKFDFSSDILKLDISDDDKEEIEVSINIDSDVRKRNRKSNIRNLKYIYLESRGFYNIIFIGAFIGLVVLGITIYNAVVNVEKPDYVYSYGGISFKVRDSYIINKNYKGNNINNLIVLDIDMLSYKSESIELNNFSLLIEGVTFKPVTKYASSLIDIGVSYMNDELTDSYNNYLVVFDVPEKYVGSKILLKYVGSNGVVKIKVNPIELKSEPKTITYNLGEEANMIDSLGDIKFKITEFDIQNSFVVNYDYCHNDVCIPSLEYIKPSINSNFDKVVMRLKVEFTNNSNIKITDFYDLLSRFGIIKYDEKLQNRELENIKSTKKNTGYIYVGVNQDIINSNSIKLLFNIRNVNLEYNLRG